MASILKVDDLRGNTAAGNITITSEGGSATMQLQQGLAKAWNNYTQVSTVSITDSFNVSSISDVGTGMAQTSYTNSMANAAYVVSGSHNQPGGNSASIISGYDNSADFATGTVTVSTFNASSGRLDVSLSQMAVNGDLA